MSFNVRCLFALSLVFVSAILLVGCDQAPLGKGGIHKAEVGAVPASPQRPGDPAKGYDALLNRSVVTCGLPYEAYVRTRGAAAEPGPQFPGRTGRNSELPYLLTSHVAQSGVEIVTSNCLACHAASFNGELVMGLGNEFLDLTVDPLIGIEAAGGAVKDGPEADEWRRWADRITAIADYMITDTVGVNSANNLTLALMAHRDPETLAWSDTPLIEPPPKTPAAGQRAALVEHGQETRDVLQRRGPRGPCPLHDPRLDHLYGLGRGGRRDRCLVRRRAHLSGEPSAAEISLQDRSCPCGARLYCLSRHLQGVSRHLRR
jgi:hypothetical protein